jgi:hypothetical protein
MSAELLRTTIEYARFKLVVDFKFTRGKPATLHDPADPDEIEIQHCWLIPAGATDPICDLEALDLLAELGIYDSIIADCFTHIEGIDR